MVNPVPLSRNSETVAILTGGSIPWNTEDEEHPGDLNDGRTGRSKSLADHRYGTP